MSSSGGEWISNFTISPGRIIQNKERLVAMTRDKDLESKFDRKSIEEEIHCRLKRRTERSMRNGVGICGYNPIALVAQSID